MKSTAIPRALARLLRQQGPYLLVGFLVYAIYWAATGYAPKVATTLIYTLFLSNFTALSLENLIFPNRRREPQNRWAFFLLLLTAVSAVAVTLSTAIVFLAVTPAPRGSFWHFLMSGWKFPFVANMVFGAAFLIHRITSDRLEERNRQLQVVVDREIAGRELQDDELQRAREIQQGFLPKEVPQVAGFEIAGSWEPARAVGGDYYDFIRLSPTKVAICIADVVGKGVSAALLMANLQASIRAFASESAAPAWVCERVNSVLCSNIAAGKFVTLFYGVLDAEDYTFRYTNAGHPYPVLVDKSGTATQLDHGGALLGVFPDWKYDDASVKLSPGDHLVLFTDGITEAATPDGEEFGERRLIAVAQALAGTPASDLKAKLLSDVKAFCDSRFQDDATLVVVSALAPADSAKRLPLDLVLEQHARLSSTPHP